jgi:Flp pilus assembly protein TadG
MRADTRKRRKGQALVETGLIIVTFVAMLVGVMDLGQILFFHQSLVERVRSGVRWGAVHAYDETSIKNMIRYNQATQPVGAQPFLGISDSNITVSRLDSGLNTERIQVAIVNFQFYFVSPWIAKTFTNDNAVVETLPTEYRQ